MLSHLPPFPHLLLLIYHQFFSTKANNKIYNKIPPIRVATGLDIIQKYPDLNPEFNEYEYSDLDIFRYIYRYFLTDTDMNTI
jgi:hypothetical protein